MLHTKDVKLELEKNDEEYCERIFLKYYENYEKSHSCVSYFIQPPEIKASPQITMFELETLWIL
jgi:hypothetical protein